MMTFVRFLIKEKVSLQRKVIISASVFPVVMIAFIKLNILRMDCHFVVVQKLVYSLNLDGDAS